jgi:hypothetical protein
MSDSEQGVGAEAIVPQEVVDKVKEITEQWLREDSYAYVEAYNAKPHRDIGEWRLRICRRSNNDTLVEHLVPKHADGHTYMLMIAGMAVAADVGRRQAICALALDAALNITSSQGIKKEDLKQYFAEGSVQTRAL